MKGTIISVNKILEFINEGDMEKASRVFKIYMSGGIHIVNLTDLTIKDFIKDCMTDNVIFVKNVKPITGDDVYKAIKENLKSLGYMYRICSCGSTVDFVKCTCLSINELIDSIEDKNVKFIIIEQEWES